MQPSSTILAIVGGRFLPVEEYNLSIETNSQKVAFANSLKAMSVETDSEIVGTIMTKRQPMLKYLSDIWIIHSDKKYYIEDCMNTESARIYSDGMEMWEIQFSGKELTETLL